MVVKTNSTNALIANACNLPLMRGYMDSPYCQAKPVCNFLVLDCNSTFGLLCGLFLARTKMSIRWKRPHSLDDLFDPPHQQASISSV